MHILKKTTKKEPFTSLTEVVLPVHPGHLHTHSIQGPVPPASGCRQSISPHPQGAQELSIHPLWASFFGMCPPSPST